MLLGSLINPAKKSVRVFNLISRKPIPLLCIKKVSAVQISSDLPEISVGSNLAFLSEKMLEKQKDFCGVVLCRDKQVFLSPADDWLTKWWHKRVFYSREMAPKRTWWKESVGLRNCVLAKQLISQKECVFFRCLFCGIFRLFSFLVIVR